MFTCEMSEGKKIETKKYMTGMITAEWNDTIMCYAPFIEFRSGVKISDNDLNDFIENHWEEVYNQKGMPMSFSSSSASSSVLAVVTKMI